MRNKEILAEVRGTIVHANENQIPGIIVQPDDPNDGLRIGESFDDRDYSQFEVGQRVVLVTYCDRRTINPGETEEWIRGENPDNFVHFDYATYDEQTYDREKEKEIVKKRS